MEKYPLRIPVLITCLAASVALPLAASERTLYHGATLIDGTGAVPRPATSILVSDGVIESVMPDSDATELDATRVSADGLYAIPGLIDTHVHLATPPDADRSRTLLRRQVQSGITGVRSMADDVRSVAELARQALTGEIPAPDIHFAALMAGPSFFDDPRTIAVTRGHVPGHTPWMQAIDAETDIAAAVAIARGTSASGIKLYANLEAEAIVRITAEAHRQGIPVWAHAAVFPALPVDNILAGVDVISHSCPLAYQVSSSTPVSYQDPMPVDARQFQDGIPPAMIELFARMAAQGIILDATNLVYARHEAAYAARAEGRPPRCSAMLTYQLTRAAYLQGVRIASGTDGDNPPEAPWPSLHDELEILAGPVGMAPMDVLLAATSVAAAAMNASDTQGTVEPGKLANLVFLKADPLQDVSNLREVAFTLKRGAVHRRTASADKVPSAR
ncbi:amidohydrolase family protein [Luteimonas fraxinea]|uniref:amidohydrolase family protein n=1 Tax=Luteimonas fraxinea TaxID=2901869 RepID=UPI001E3BB17E|nr:amidohydrolase family protein [Luteimonas fraxinea]MCD9127198.1 amidohydrolase family protein [Luteimonas fraxinea]